MDRDGLAARLDSYGHRYDDLTADILTFIEDATKHIGVDLRSQHNMNRTEVAVVSGASLLPADFEEMFNCQRSDGKRLQYITADYASEWREESGEPRFYSIAVGGIAIGNASLEVFPKATESIFVEYFGQPDALSAGGSFNTVLSNLPLLYIYKCLSLMATWANDWESVGQLDNAYERELARANRAWVRARRTTDAVGQSTHPFVASPAKGV